MYLIVALLFLHLSGKCNHDNKSNIYFMREKSIFCCMVGMHIWIDGLYIFNLKNGKRLIVRTNSNDSLKIQIFYPPMYRFKTEVIYKKTDIDKSIFIDLKYKNKSYDPFLFIQNKFPTFEIEIKEMTPIEGEIKFNNEKMFNKKLYEIKL